MIEREQHLACFNVLPTQAGKSAFVEVNAKLAAVIAELGEHQTRI